MKRLRANTLKDHCNFLLHFGSATAIAAASFAVLGCPPVLSAIALGTTAGLHLALQPKVKRAFQEAIDEERRSVRGRPVLNLDSFARGMGSGRFADIFHYFEQAPDLTPRLQKWADEFSRKLGMKSTPQVLLMERGSFTASDGPQKGLKNALRKFLREKFNDTANAFAFSHSKDNVVLNAPIVEQLSPQQLKGVLGHEVGHIAANHLAKHQALAVVSTPARILTSLNTAVTAFSSWKNAGHFFLGTAIGGFAGGIAAHLLGLSESNPQHQAILKPLKATFNTAAVMGVGIIGGAPDLVFAVGLEVATGIAMKLISKRYSRCAEFQADRIAAELSGDPKGMSDGLEKIGALYKRHAMKQSGMVIIDAKHPPERNGLSSLFKHTGDLIKTHPSIDRRCARLDKMEQRVEYIYT